VCCRLMQCIAVCCSVLQCAAMHVFEKYSCTRCSLKRFRLLRGGAVKLCGLIAICQEGHCDWKMRWDPVG